MAMKVATMSHTLMTEIGKVQLQAKEYHDNSEMFQSTAFVTAIAEDVAKALIAKDTTKGKGRATIEPALPKPNRRTQAQPTPPPPPPPPQGATQLTSPDEEEMDWAAIVDETDRIE